MKKTGRRKKIAALALTAALLAGMLAACGNAGGTDGGKTDAGAKKNGSDGTGTEKDAQWDEGTPMGRYVEEDVEFNERLSLLGGVARFFRMEDGTLLLAQNNGMILQSKDNGKNWGEKKFPWLTRMQEEGTYILCMALGADGTAAVVWTEPLEEDALEKAAQSAEQEEEMERDSAYPITLDTKLTVIKPDNTEIPADIKLEEEDMWINAVYISDSGRIIVSTLGDNLYEVAEDGKGEKFLTVDDGRPELVRFHKNLMLMDGWGYAAPLIYDMEEKEYIEDEVLSDFVAENYRVRDSYGGENYDLFLFSGGDDIIYAAGAKGVYRHVLGGSVMEQVIDGSLSTFGNPAYRIMDMISVEDNEFLVLFGGGNLVRFVFDPDIPTVPTGKVKVYSLEDNVTVRQAISIYQTANPAVYVEYEVGLSKDNSLTWEDAVKSLNARIMAGEGPDVLILDNMPVDSYIEKGLLVDIGPVLDSVGEDEGLFENVVEAFREDGHIYVMPCEMQLPFILGRNRDLNKMTDLSGIADTVEDMRKDDPGANILEIPSAKGIMRMFSMVSAPAWKTENGTVDRKAVADFLTQTKRIYDAQMDGLPEKALLEWEEISQYYVEELGETIEDSDYIRQYKGELGFMGGLRKFAMGSLANPEEYMKEVSVVTEKGFEDCGIIPMTGQCGDVFWARTLMGISAASANMDQAQDFVRTAFGRQVQTNLLRGMAVNKNGLLGDLENRRQRSQNNIYSSILFSTDDGVFIDLTVRAPDEEEVDALFKWIESVRTVYVEDDTFEGVVYEEGTAYIMGDKSLDAALDSIEKRLGIYLAE